MLFCIGYGWGGLTQDIPFFQISSSYVLLWLYILFQIYILDCYDFNLWFDLTSMRQGWWGWGNPNFFLNFLRVGLNYISIPNFSFLGCPELVDLWLGTKQNKNKHIIIGFLSLRLELMLEPGLEFRLRLTKKSRAKRISL